MLKANSRYLVVILLLSFLLVLSACQSGTGTSSQNGTNTAGAAADTGGQETEAETASTEQTPAKGFSGTLKVQLVGDFAFEDKTDPVTGQTAKGVKILKDEFEKRYPGVTVEFLLMGWDNYNEKTQTMLQSGAADVYQVPGIANFAEQGLLEPLQPYIERDSFDLGIYLNGQVDGWRAMGPDDQQPEIYGLPFIGDARLIVYDKQLFDEWGVEYLSESPSVDEVMEKAAKMTGKNPKTGEQNYGLTFNGNDAADTVMNINESLGGQWGTGFLWKDMKLEFDSATMIKAAEWLKEAKKLAPEGVLVNQGSENFYKDNNNVAIHLRSAPGFINSLETFGTQDRYQAALLFTHPDKGMGGMFAGSPFAIGTTSQNKDLAWEWLKFSGSEFFQQYMWDEQRSQSMPVVKAAAEWESVKATPQMDVILKQMSQLWAPRYPYRSGQPRYILSENIERILLGEASAADAMKKAQEEATKWLESQK
ncbi:extracellular solute-binding protein [Paenibacillus tarimensis]|uniref:extracellular solute-binding protein n=1 Tax=Paenibacillus tarimensis TaxID=416012 RepID=UPI001F3B10E6|nr:extracellular solute-binding protein [Paenibacillus tarimensis]MCF2944325.1 extracellular solute-binding protein [Paenibacillus tarimensis]